MLVLSYVYWMIMIPALLTGFSLMIIIKKMKEQHEAQKAPAAVPIERG